MATTVMKSNGQEEPDYLFKVGEMFDTFEELESKLEKYSKNCYVHFWRRDSRTVNGAHMKTHRHINERLKYYSVKYACIYGGQKFLPRGIGRRHSQSIRTNCPAHIMLRASKDGNQLEVTSVNEDHNHEVSEELFSQLPQERKLSGEIKQEVQDLMQLHIDRKRVKEYVLFRTNKNLRTKDLFNIAAANKNKKDIPPERAYELIQRIHDFEKLQNDNVAVKSGVSESEEEGPAVKRVKTEHNSPWGHDSISNEMETIEENGEEYVQLSQEEVADELDADNELMSENQEEEFIPANGEIVNELAMEDGDPGTVVVESIVGSDGSVFVNDNEFNYCGNSLNESINEENSTDNHAGEMDTISTVQIGKMRKNRNHVTNSNKTVSSHMNENVPEKIWIMRGNNLIENIENDIDNCYHGNESHKHHSDNDNDNDVILDDNTTNQQILVEQLAVLKAEKAKLVEETEVLRLKRNKLNLQIHCCNNELRKQEMEKEKIRLEIKLLKSKIQNDDNNDISHFIFVPEK